MHPQVRIRLQDGRLVELGPGDIIGRTDRAALCLSEPHISEAHAMVSLRAGELKLLALRGRFSVDGKAASQATLRAGQRLVLASRTPLEVDAVHLPAEVLALVEGEQPPQVLASVCSLRVSADPPLVAGFSPNADAMLWTSGSRLFVRVGEEVARELAVGDALTVGGRTLRVVMTTLEAASHRPTQESSEIGAPLHLILGYDTVHIIAGAHRLTLDGIGARIVCELAAVRAPIGWREVANEIWGRDACTEELLRERWDSSLARLRRKLRQARLRTDLVQSCGGGLAELVLGPGDTMEDRM